MQMLSSRRLMQRKATLTKLPSLQALLKDYQSWTRMESRDSSGPEEKYDIGDGRSIRQSFTSNRKVTAAIIDCNRPN